MKIELEIDTEKISNADKKLAAEIFGIKKQAEETPAPQPTSAPSTRYTATYGATDDTVLQVIKDHPGLDNFEITKMIPNRGYGSITLATCRLQEARKIWKDVKGTFPYGFYVRGDRPE